MENIATMAIYKNKEVTIVSEPSDETGKWKIAFKDGTWEAVTQGELQFTEAEKKQYVDRKVEEVKNSLNTVSDKDVKEARETRKKVVEQEKDKFAPNSPVLVK